MNIHIHNLYFFKFLGQDTKIRFSLEPYPGDPSFNQWKDAMKMVARLPEGVPTEFRKKVKSRNPNLVKYIFLEVECERKNCFLAVANFG